MKKIEKTNFSLNEVNNPWKIRAPAIFRQNS